MSYVEDINNLGSVTFDDMLSASSKNLSSMSRQAPWVGLSHGVKLLENDEECLKYLCAYGGMHRQKINLALDSISDLSVFVDNEVTIIDWGCGQALATICFFDYMHKLGLVPNVKKIILIEPSAVALRRAVFNLSKYVDTSIISDKNLYIDDVTREDIETKDGITLHFFSNILDIPTVDLAKLSKDLQEYITSEQISICVGPQNLGSSRIAEFAKLFKITENDLVKAYSGKLAGRGTVNLLVFRIKEQIAEIIKVAYEYHRAKSQQNSSVLQSMLKDVTPYKDQPKNALLFYKLVLELERYKSSDIKDSYPLPFHFGEGTQSSKLNVDITDNKDFEAVFRKNSNRAYTKWPKDLNIGIGVIIDNKVYRILQYIYPYEDIKDIDIDRQYVSVSLSDFMVDPRVADDLEMGEDMQKAIEVLLKDSSLDQNKLESLLKDAISNDLTLEDQLLVSMTSENATLSQVTSELNSLLNNYQDYNTLLDSFLRGYLNANHVTDVNPETLIKVVDMDESQRKATQSAIESRVSVVTGPPGTGKTQMILNLITNLLIRDKSVIIASKINKAVDNIKERFDAIDDYDYLLRFGSKDNINNSLLPYLSTISRRIETIDSDKSSYERYKAKYLTACELVEKGRKLLLELGTLQDELGDLSSKKQKATIEKEDVKQKHLAEDADFRESNSETIGIIEESSESWENKKNEFQSDLSYIQERNSGIKGLFFDWFGKKKYATTIWQKFNSFPLKFREKISNISGVSAVSDLNKRPVIIDWENSCIGLIDNIITFQNALKALNKRHKSEYDEVDSKLKDIEKKQETCKNRLEAISASQNDIEQKIADGKAFIDSISKDFLEATIERCLVKQGSNLKISRYTNYLEGNVPWSPDAFDTYVRDARNFIDVFRLNAVTNLSVKNAYPLEKELVDFVIIDEASQCDIASALPLMLRAKQIVVIGDPLQLRHISAVNHEEELTIKEKLGLSENPTLRYSDLSLYDYCNNLILTADNNNRKVVLEGHYRCHPEIIGYSNKFFYERLLGVRLQINTKEANPSLRKKGIIWEDVKGTQKSDSQNINEDEITKCLQIASELLQEDKNIQIGIITPFRHQAQEINAKMPDTFGERVVADTVYKFQGAERDVIIYSLVVTDNSPDSKIYWIDHNCPNLVNVAVTRAKTALYVVGNRDYINKHSNKSRPLGYLAYYTEHHATIVSNSESRTYVIDTNVFIDEPNIIEQISKDDQIIVPMKVMDELDKLKIALSPEERHNAERAIRNINTNHEKRNIRLECADVQYLPDDLRKNNADNMILSVAMKFKNQHVTLITSDNGLQVKAKGLGIATESLREFYQ